MVEFAVRSFYKGDVMRLVRAEEKRREELWIVGIGNNALAHAEAQAP